MGKIANDICVLVHFVAACVTCSHNMFMSFGMVLYPNVGPFLLFMSQNWNVRTMCTAGKAG